MSELSHLPNGHNEGERGFSEHPCSGSKGQIHENEGLNNLLLASLGTLKRAIKSKDRNFRTVNALVLSAYLEG